MADKKAVFISYRRSDSQGYALAIYRDVSRRFGRDAVFFDLGSIEPGLNFRRR